MTSLAADTSNDTTMMSQDGAACYRSFGSPTSVPDSDVSFLAYYLKCCNLGCGIETIQASEMMDYKIAHIQPAHIQQAIYQLALTEFNPVRLVNRIMFIDDANILLPPETGNGFYERSAVSQVLTTNNGLVLPGGLEQNPMNVRKFMFCTTPWLEAFCIGPLYRYYQNNCSVNTSIAVARPMGFSQGIPASSIAQGEGEGIFPCRQYQRSCCSPKTVSMCNSCHRIGCGVRRYQCSVCPECSLCEECYNDPEAHDQTHAFQIFVGGGNVPIQHLSPRIQPVTPELDYEQGDIPMADAVPIEDVTPSFQPRQTEEGLSSSFLPGQTVRLTGLTMARRLSGCIAVVEDCAFNLIIVSLLNQQDERYAFKPEDLKLLR